MDKRSFLKTAGVVAATLAVREGAGMAWQNMKQHTVKRVIAINGSPNESDATAYALSCMEPVFQQHNITWEVIHIGDKEIRGCIACERCRTEGNCIFSGEEEKGWIARMQTADAIVLATPVFFGGMAGTLKSFLDRSFYANGRSFQHKLGAAVVTSPRDGASTAFESLNQYFTISQMPVVSSRYWNNMYGNSADEWEQDQEGVAIMKTLAENIVALLKA